MIGQIGQGNRHSQVSFLPVLLSTEVLKPIVDECESMVLPEKESSDFLQTYQRRKTRTGRTPDPSIVKMIAEGLEMDSNQNNKGMIGANTNASINDANNLFQNPA